MYCSLDFYSCAIWPCRIDGNTPIAARQQQMRDFNDPESQVFVFLISTRAGGVGIDLVSVINILYWSQIIINFTWFDFKLKIVFYLATFYCLSHFHVNLVLQIWGLSCTFFFYFKIHGFSLYGGNWEVWLSCIH